MTTEKVSAAQLQVYLKGIDYPVNKQQMLDHARSLNAPQNVMSALENLPERHYNSPTEVEQEFGKTR